MKKVLIVFSLVLLSFDFLGSGLKRVDYEGFTVWLNCQENGAEMFYYKAVFDSANEKKPSGFSFDSRYRDCQQTSTDTYQSSPEKYDRGHMVPANHLDYSKTSIKQSMKMTNILPHARKMNQRGGAWRYTEDLIECYRDVEPLDVWGGVIWGSDVTNDHFISSHGVRTPDLLWKVVVGRTKFSAWIIPNKNSSLDDNIEDYYKTIEEIEWRSGRTVPVNDDIKGVFPRNEIRIPKVSCSIK
jgi:endonuclease G, mitochondrial